MKLRGLYAVTPELANTQTLLRSVAQALEGGIAMLQYRRKGGQQIDEANTLARMCRERDVLFIVNDDIALALACGAGHRHRLQRNQRAPHRGAQAKIQLE